MSSDEEEKGKEIGGNELIGLFSKLNPSQSETSEEKKPSEIPAENPNPEKEDSSDESSSSSSSSSISTKTTTESPTKKREGLTVKDFKFGDQLGEGSFGRVVVATEIATGQKWAVKILEKKHIIKENKVKYVKAERNILNMINHDNVIKLYCTFQDNKNLYLVMELAEGGEMFQKIRRITPQGAQFYSAEIVSVLEYLEKNGIVHRDLKPENILLDAEGHIKLTDFGTAKQISDEAGASGARNTFCGTPEYVSPEVLRDQEATKAADLWALGCVIFQLIAHRPPFRADSEYLLFQKILNVEYEFPADFPADAKDLIQKLLTLDPNQRLGMGEHGYQDIKSHPYFTGLDFSLLQELKPPDLLPESAVPQPKVHNAPPKGALNDAPNEARAKQLEEQKSSPWAKFVFPNELIVKHGLVSKRKGLSVKKRQLILTDYPRIFYVDPEERIKKGDIPWSANLKVEAKGEKSFLIHTPSRTYKLETIEGPNAAQWVEAVTNLQQATQKSALEKQQSGASGSAAPAPA